MEDYDTFVDGYRGVGLVPGPTATIEPAVLLADVMQVESSVKSEAGALFNRAGYVFDPLMKDHAPYTELDQDHPERPERIQGIYDILRSNRLLERMTNLVAIPVTKEQACLVHSDAQWEDVQAIRSGWIVTTSALGVC